MIVVEGDTWVNAPRGLAFILAPSDQGTLIVNRFDGRIMPDGRGIGVGFTVLHQASYDSHDISFARMLLGLRRRHFGDGVAVVDCGANIGIMTLEWAKAMTGWGSVLAIEAQERIYYALAGNIALANCFNVRAIHAAVGAEPGMLRIPTPNYCSPGSFGSLELRQRQTNEDIGQAIHYDEARLSPVRVISIDSLEFPRLDFLKIGVEGMEDEVLAGAAKTIDRCRPVMTVEHIKSDGQALVRTLTGYGYRCMFVGMNILAVHESDPTLSHITIKD
jgi:FkbM family methyltransferase